MTLLCLEKQKLTSSFRSIGQSQLRPDPNPILHEKLSDQIHDPVKLPSKKKDQKTVEVKSTSAERDNIDSRYQMATIQQGYVN